MPPFLCKVEVVPRNDIVDPTSENKMRELQKVGGEVAGRISNFGVSTLICFTLDCETAEKAKAIVDEMSARFLVKPELATPNITVEEVT